MWKPQFSQEPLVSIKGKKIKQIGIIVEKAEEDGH